MQARRAIRWGLVVAASFVPGPALLAQDKPPVPPAGPAAKSPDALDADVDALHRLVGQQQWRQGVEAGVALFRKYPGDTRILVRLDEIEEDLRICAYRAQRKPLDGAAVLGRGVSNFSFSTRNAEFRFDAATIASLAGSPGWDWSGNVAVFDVPMEGTITVSMTVPVRAFLRRSGTNVEALPLPACFFCFDTENRGGYTISVAPTAVSGTETSVFGDYDVRLTRLGRDERPVGKGGATTITTAKRSIALKFARSVTGVLSCAIDGSKVAEGLDQKFTHGFLGVAAGRDLFTEIASLHVSGRVETTYARRIESEAEGARYRKWLAEGWKRESVLPAWVVEAEKRLPPPPLPSDATAAVRAQVEPLLPLVLRGAAFGTESLRLFARTAPKRTAAYLFALAAIADGDWAASDVYLKGILTDERSFGPAWIALARSQMERGDSAGAEKTLDEAKSAAPQEPGIWDMLAAIELSAGRLDGAEKALDDAARSGSVTPWARELRRIFLRMKRGPQWQRRFDYESPHYRITSDTNLNTCLEVAKVLEEANASYKAKFRPRADGAKAQVCVFAGEESYLDYAGSLGSDLTNTLGVYMPKLRQLCVFLHEDRRTLWDTVRHEGFHQYLHQFIEDAPDWFNEGYAQYFGFVRKAGGKHVTGTVDEGAAAAVAGSAPGFSPLARLFVMNHREFMEKAAVHYPQSWLVVHFLRETKDPALAGVLDRYLDALVAGRSREDAYKEVLAPLLPKIEAGIARHVRELTKK